MIAYLVLGTGVLLVFGSVIYTYRVDRKITQKQNESAFEETTVRGSIPTEQPFAQMVKTAQVKESIGTIGKDLDVLIDELREKEAEVKQIVKKVKGWQLELSVTAPEILQAEQPEKSTQSSSDDTAKESNAKYEQITRLLEEGLSIEEIARKLSMGRREVELVAKIRKKGATASA